MAKGKSTSLIFGPPVSNATKCQDLNGWFVVGGGSGGYAGRSGGVDGALGFNSLDRLIYTGFIGGGIGIPGTEEHSGFSYTWSQRWF